MFLTQRNNKIKMGMKYPVRTSVSCYFQSMVTRKQNKRYSLAELLGSASASLLPASFEFSSVGREVILKAANKDTLTCGCAIQAHPALECRA